MCVTSILNTQSSGASGAGKDEGVAARQRRKLIEWQFGASGKETAASGESPYVVHMHSFRSGCSEGWGPFCRFRLV